MNLNGTLVLDNVDEAHLADLAGSLVNEPGAVDWELVTEFTLNDLGPDAVRVLALLVLNTAKVGPETRETVLKAIINASTTDEVSIDATHHRARAVGYYDRVPDDDAGWEIHGVEIHGIQFGIGDLTDRGCDEALEHARRDA